MTDRRQIVIGENCAATYNRFGSTGLLY